LLPSISWRELRRGRSPISEAGELPASPGPADL
jgi:hypothetical protein